ncbi:MAG: hypothetical protein F4058_06580 [Rhodothermaceae bacterium]|nr:hypothetical protein [Rhodothermaceae bacterium]MYF64043.1 hypothetical protein [Rhodothermaceae bacterium]MYI84988.1 hypothetical protein [Rhodothermaceae bacterium]
MDDLNPEHLNNLGSIFRAIRETITATDYAIKGVKLIRNVKSKMNSWSRRVPGNLHFEEEVIISDILTRSTNELKRRNIDPPLKDHGDFQVQKLCLWYISPKSNCAKYSKNEDAIICRMANRFGLPVSYIYVAIGLGLTDRMIEIRDRNRRQEEENLAA